MRKRFTVLPFYLAEPDKPEMAARLAEMSLAMKADLAAGKAWEGGLYQSVDLRPLLGRITSPTLVVVCQLDFICGSAQAQPIAGAITGFQFVMPAGCGHIPSIEVPQGIPPGGREFPPSLVHTPIPITFSTSQISSQWHTCVRSHAADRR